MLSDIEKAVLLYWRLSQRAILWLLAVVAGGYVFYRIRTIVFSVLVAVLLTYVMLPWVEWLCRRRKTRVGPKTQRLLATMLVFCVFLAFVGAGIALIIHPFKEETVTLQRNFGAYSAQIQDFVASAGTWYEKSVPTNVKQLVAKLDFSRVAEGVTGYAQGLAKFATSSIGIVLELVLIPVLAFYFLLDYRSITREVYGLVPKSRRREAVKIGRGIGEILQSYIFGQIILCVIAGVLTGIVLSVLQVPYVVVLALFAGITRAIPIIGPVVSGVPIVLVGLLSFQGDLTIAAYLFTFIIVMHFVESKFIMPRLIGDRLHLHPAVVIIVLLIGAEFFGLMGMFLAAPIAAVIRELVRIYYIRPRDRAEGLAGPVEMVGTKQ